MSFFHRNSLNANNFRAVSYFIVSIIIPIAIFSQNDEYPALSSPIIYTPKTKKSCTKACNFLRLCQKHHIEIYCSSMKLNAYLFSDFKIVSETAPSSKSVTT